MAAVVDKDKCTGCESCISDCPSEAIKMVDGKADIDTQLCIDCGVCVDTCPVGAISLE